MLISTRDARQPARNRMIRVQPTRDDPGAGRAIEQSVLPPSLSRYDHAAGRAGTRVGERIVDRTCDRTSDDQLDRLTASVPHAGRACMREPSERSAAGQRGSMLAGRGHQLTRKQHPWASRESMAARVVPRVVQLVPRQLVPRVRPRPSQHQRRSPISSRRCWQLPCRPNTID